VENASLLSWLMAVALIHSLTVYRQRGTFKRWAVMCACLTFAFVIVGTFISRSGIVQSVHAFEANAVSTVLFGALIIVPVVVGGAMLIWRHEAFGADVVGQGAGAGEGAAADAGKGAAKAGKAAAADAGKGAAKSGKAGAGGAAAKAGGQAAKSGGQAAETESMFSKDIAYYLNNIIMLVCTILLTYMTVSSALPSWMPFGGQALSSVTYNAIARPVGVLYCLVIAVCPLLAWGKTDRGAFFKQARVPAICAGLLFILLMVYFFGYLGPTYYGIVTAGGSAAETLRSAGPWPAYAAITILGFLAASLLFFNSLFMLARSIRRRVRRVQMLGGLLAHTSMAIILVGLIGSSMYVTERSGYMAYDEDSGIAGEPFRVRDYTLNYVSKAVEPLANGDDVLYGVTFDVYKGGDYLGQLTPGVQVVQSTQQQKLLAAVLSSPLEDLFVVYKGVNDEGAFSLDVRVNPLVSFVWIGFAMLMAGTAIAAFGRRRPRRR
jgi:cytochrome c-type biogenesis protein CcmF